MGAFAEFMEKHKIKPESLARVSDVLERGAEADAAARLARAKARADKKPYAELNIAKPTSGRGVSALKVREAMEDKPMPKRVRAKLLRAARKMSKGDNLAAKDLFGEVARKPGLRRVADAVKKAGAKKAGG